MFNFQLIKRNTFNQSYRYIVCMVLILSGVYISVNGYNPEFVISKAEGTYILKEMLKIILICYTVKLFKTSRIAFALASVMLVYTGACAGCYLMFVLNNMSALKMILSVIPSSIKFTGIIFLYSDMFSFDKYDNNNKIWLAGLLYFVGDFIFALMI